jgi:hypothetical protein
MKPNGRKAMVPECWFCGRPIKRDEPAESLHGCIAVHAKCVQRDIDPEREETDVMKRAA